MRTVLVTGYQGFIGRNLMERLRQRVDLTVVGFGRGDTLEFLAEQVQKADFIFHLAGVNRPAHLEEFETVNVGLTRILAELWEATGRAIPLVFSSSIQADLKNPYGRSKRQAEEVLIHAGRSLGAPLYLYRLPNVFGKWCRPGYNSVVATFCYNISHGLGITISDRSRKLELLYIDQVIDEFIRILDGLADPSPHEHYSIPGSFLVSLGELADGIYQIHEMRKSLLVPNSGDSFQKALYATYLSYLDKADFSYTLPAKMDIRGSLFEILKSEQFGQILISTSREWIKRGNHYHHTKSEKFCVLKGKALIRLKNLATEETIEYRVSDQKLEVVDIPPGYTHMIENTGPDEMLLLVWANEIFDAAKPDTYYHEV